MAGNAVLKEFSVAVDLKRTLPMIPFEVVAGDTGSVINVAVYDDGDAISLDDMYVTAVFQSPKGTRLQDSADGSVSIDGNTVSIALLPGAVSPGLVSCELEIWSSSQETPESREDFDVLVTTARFTFHCRAAMLDGDALNALPETPLLAEFLAEANAAEAMRTYAENEREQAEEARAAAEEAREQAFEALLAAAIGVSKTGTGAPTSSTQGSSGQLYFDLQNKNIYVCTATSPSYSWRMLQFADGSANGLTVTRQSTYQFADIPAYTDMTLQELVSRLGGWYSEIAGKQDELQFDSAPSAQSSAPVTSAGIYAADHAEDWVDIFSGTLSEDVSVITLNSYSSGNGSGAFAFDELRLLYLGEMQDGTGVKLFINGITGSHFRFVSFACNSTEYPESCMTEIVLRKPEQGFAAVERSYGGDPDDTGVSASTAKHFAPLKVSGVTRYNAVKLCSEGSAVFAAGSKLLLQGRNLR